MQSWGLKYGPAFTNVCEVRNDRVGQSVGTVRMPDIPYQISEGAVRPHVVHPGTLDAVFHLAFAAVKDGKYDVSTAMVPKSIDSITILANAPWQPGNRMPGFCHAGKHGMRELVADVVMLDDETQLPTIMIQGFLCTEVQGASTKQLQRRRQVAY